MARRSDEDDADASLLKFWLKFTLAIEGDQAVKHDVAALKGSAWRVLVELATTRPPKQDGSIDVEALGKKCGLSPATTYRVLADLESVGYIRRSRSGLDGRLLSELELTKAGRHALGRIKHAAGSPS